MSLKVRGRVKIMMTWFFLGNVETDKSRNVAENASSDRERERAGKRRGEGGHCE